MIGAVADGGPEPMRARGRPSAMRSPSAVVAVFLLTMSLSLLPLASAVACSCVQLGPGQALANADAAFVGVVAAAQDPSAGNPIVGSADPIVYSVVVEEALKGDLPEGQRVVLTSARDGASCGISLAVGDRWRLYANVDGSALTTGLCSGSELLARGVAVPAVDTPDGGPGLPAGVLLVAAGVVVVGAVSALAFTWRCAAPTA